MAMTATRAMATFLGSGVRTTTAEARLGTTVASLGPRFETMQPVPVFTGGADTGPPGKASVTAAAAAPPSGGAEVSIPLPRPRPSYVATQ